MQSITVELQEAIRLLKNSISSQIIKVAAYQRLLRQLIANKDELSLMNLSMLRDNHDHYRKPYSPELLDRAEDISELLETYLMDYNTLGTKLEFLRARMQNTDELVGSPENIKISISPTAISFLDYFMNGPNNNF